MRKEELTTAFRQEKRLSVVLPSGEVVRVVIVTHVRRCRGRFDA
jgi:hypothetical protein